MFEAVLHPKVIEIEPYLPKLRGVFRSPRDDVDVQGLNVEHVVEFIEAHAK